METRRFWVWMSGAALAGVLAVVFADALTPFATGTHLHAFADTRTLLGLPNFVNVFSNAAYLLVGLAGLSVLRGSRERGAWHDAREERAYALFFAGAALEAYVSAYYHLAPTSDRLLWDRLPGAVQFMAFLSAVISERVGVRMGTSLLMPMVAMGVGSVIYWHLGEHYAGDGDIRPYTVLAALPLVVTPIAIALRPARYTHAHLLLWALGWFIVAKVAERLDARVFAVGHVLSGHSLKHVASALSAAMVCRMLYVRSPAAERPDRVTTTL